MAQHLFPEQILPPDASDELLERPVLLLDMIRARTQLSPAQLQSLSRSLIAIAGEADQLLLKLLPQVVPLLVSQNKRSFVESVPGMLSALRRRLDCQRTISQVLVPALLQIAVCESQPLLSLVLNQLADLVLQLGEARPQVLGRVISMGHDEESPDHRVAAVRIMGRLAVCFGSQLCERFILPQLLSLGVDPHPQVRISVVQGLPSFGKLLCEQSLTQRLFPFFFSKLYQPPAFLQLAMAHTINELSQLSSENNVHRLEETMVMLLSHSSQEVRNAAYARLGRFVFKCAVRSQRLLQLYLSSALIDQQSQYHFVYNLPAILLCYGTKAWELARSIYFNIAEGVNHRARASVVQSLGQISKLILYEDIGQQLLPLVLLFLRDESLDLRLSAMKQAAQIMLATHSQLRDKILEVLFQVQKNAIQWRARESVAEQIDSLSTVLSQSEVYNYLAPMLLKLCSDEVSQVRAKACLKLASLAQKFVREKNSAYLSPFIQLLMAYSESKVALHRQSFTLIYKAIQLKPTCAEVAVSLNGCLARLATDRQVGVRIHLAGAIRDCVRQLGRVGHLVRLAEQLKQDENEVVAELGRQALLLI